jgi:hypothetical protein
MTEKPENQAETVTSQVEKVTNQPGTVTLNDTVYVISPTAFRSHYQVMTTDGKLMGLIEMTESSPERKFTARPASGAGMTLSLMMKIAEAASSVGIIK